jgi:hypothetical protein
MLLRPPRYPHPRRYQESCIRLPALQHRSPKVTIRFHQDSIPRCTSLPKIFHPSTLSCSLRLTSPTRARLQPNLVRIRLDTHIHNITNDRASVSALISLMSNSAHQGRKVTTRFRQDSTSLVMSPEEGVNLITLKPGRENFVNLLPNRWL